MVAKIGKGCRVVWARLYDDLALSLPSGVGLSVMIPAHYENGEDFAFLLGQQLEHLVKEIKRKRVSNNASQEKQLLSMLHQMWAPCIRPISLDQEIRHVLKLEERQLQYEDEEGPFKRAIILADAVQAMFRYQLGADIERFCRYAKHEGASLHQPESRLLEFEDLTAGDGCSC
eukprot:COSAG01_NODE_19753_length_991_cov_2.714126_1_plen_173_part_00